MIYCVEDDASIRELMLYALRTAGFEARGFPEAGSLFEALGEQLPRLLILDIMLPGMDGLEILRTLRSREETASVPVIMATARGTEYDKITGLDLGADDYLVKPFGMMEMVSRVRAVLRRAAPAAPQKLLTLGKLVMNPTAHTVCIGEMPLSLTLKEFDLLRLFLAHPGRVYTREQLLGSVWGTEYVGESRTVDVHIGTLRTKLGAYGDSIKTVRGVGYRLGEPA